MKKEEKKQKRNVKFKFSTVITSLLIILVGMVAFFGVYSQKQNHMENQVKDYSYAMDIKGARVISLKVKMGNNTIIKDQEGKEITEQLTDEEITQKGYKKEEIPYNNEADFTKENYASAKKVIEKRLTALGVEDYIVSLNEQTGEISIQIPENTNTDTIVSLIYQTGKFEVIDSETKEVLMTNDDIKEAKVLYSTTESGTAVYLSYEFNQNGTKKFEEITNNYKKEENTTTNNTITENTTETTAKKVTLQLDGQTITSLNFDTAIKDGKLQLVLGSATTDTNTIQGYVKQAQAKSVPVDSGKLPLTYSIQRNEFVKSDITNQELQYIAIGMAIVSAIGIIFLIVKYKMNGVLAGISYIGFAALYTLAIRYANVIISLEGIFAIGITLILNYIVLYQYLKNLKNKESNPMNKTLAEFFVKLVPICIMTVVFCFIKWIPISSFGMAMFWGILVLAIYHAIITNVLFGKQTKE